jgi:hypothetical protein
VGAASRLALVSWLAATASGCAAVTGLDGISEEDCAPLCGDAEDVGVDGPADGAGAADTLRSEDTSKAADRSGEVSMAEEAASDGAAPPPAGDASVTGTREAGSDAPGDAPFEASPADAPFEASPADAPFEASPADAPFDSGCGPLNTVTNCSACTDTCASARTVETSSTCSGDSTGLGATCSYTCASGYQDCNAAGVPDLDGCECHVPGATQAQCCVGTGTCPVAHDNGLNQASSAFFDCEGAGQLSLALATDACAAFTGDPGQCSEEICESPDGSADGDLVVCSAGSATDCVCWTYQGTNAGYLRDAQMPPGNGCYCADGSMGDPQYD